MHLVGFTIEIYYNARPYERQILMHSLSFSCGIHVLLSDPVSEALKDRIMIQLTFAHMLYGMF